MKRCNACYEEFASEFEFNVTIINGAGLGQRLVSEVSFVVAQLQREWPNFKRDPIGSVSRAVTESANRLRNFARAPHALAATITAVFVVFSAVLSVIILGRFTSYPPEVGGLEEPVEIVTLISPSTATPEGSGVGLGSNGRIGIARGKGEGSESELQRSRGGGGSGNHDKEPPQQGKPPQPSDISAPINPPLPKASLPVAGIDIDPALWRNLPFPNYGDPRSKSTAAAKGPGDGGAFGTGNGLGLGEGEGNGFGPGRNGNIGGGDKNRGCCGTGGAVGGNDTRDINRVFTDPEVTQRARVLAKPEPQYTEEARNHDITGSVILRVVFSSNGEVTNIHTVKSLPFGLTEKAIAAARQIRFIPATRNGQPVSMYMQLEYTFNLY